MKILAKTERLILRNWTEIDIDAYARIVADPEVMKYIGKGQPRDRVYAEKFVLRMIRHQENQGWMRFAVGLVRTGDLVGFCGFEIADGVIDFGWRYARNCWGKGYGGEAALAARDLGRGWFHLKGIESKSFSENAGSIKIFHRLGMTFLRESQEGGKRVVHYGFPDDEIKNA